jgi:hypothetical protein
LLSADFELFSLRAGSLKQKMLNIQLSTFNRALTTAVISLQQDTARHSFHNGAASCLRNFFHGRELQSISFATFSPPALE